ncbi:MAG: ATP-grasp domain-containing protein [Candidatus Methanomethylicaceae archaeon]|jgi:succinyl-CoA synthetase beta subunit
MRLYEYESKEILKEYGLSISRGIVISRDHPEEIEQQDLNPPLVLKAQVPVGGRGKAGGIIKVKNVEEAKRQLLSLFDKNINGYAVQKILLEEEILADRELYLSLSINRQEKSYSLVAGALGGIDIEEIAKSKPDTILKLSISPLRLINNFDVLAISNHLSVPMVRIDPIVRQLFSIAVELDAELVELNPFVIVGNTSVILDAKIIIDDSALFRHPLLNELPPRGKTKEEEEAARIGLSYVSLNGNIGIIGNGAGLTMATMDLLQSKGGHPADFLDVGAGAKSDIFRKSIHLLMKNDRVKVIFVNIFGGLTRGDEVAKGIIEALGSEPPKKPIVVRLAGTNAIEGGELLRKNGVSAYSSPLEAAVSAVSRVGGTP